MKTLCCFLLVMGLTAQQSTHESIIGKWHLLLTSEDESNVPQHRMDLVFRSEQNVLSGAVINRVTGADIPLASLSFDGKVLALTLSGSKADPPPVLTMTANGNRFEGSWIRGTERGPELKLVRFRE